jgi:beta-mannosidase
MTKSERVEPADLVKGIEWTDLNVEPWQPNGEGTQPLYRFSCALFRDGTEVDRFETRLGFKRVAWNECLGSPEGSDPWICEVNGKPVFLRGVNWTPIRPNSADVTSSMYLSRLELYRDAGFNLVRVWGGAGIERDEFYDLCDEMGTSWYGRSSPSPRRGRTTCRPSDPESLESMERIARSYIERRSHHVSFLLWCGGNELQTRPDGSPGCEKPLGLEHPMLALFRAS